METKAQLEYKKKHTVKYASNCNLNTGKTIAVNVTPVFVLFGKVQSHVKA